MEPRAAESNTPLSATVDDRIVVRGRDLADELIGELTFTQMLLLDLHGEECRPAHVRMVDAVLVALMEHGITPSTLAARLVLDGAPEATQGAVAAGLLATGSRFLGVSEEAAAFVQRIVAENRADLDRAAEASVAATLEAGGRVPGFGHNLHSAVDPRVDRLLGQARSEGVAGPHVAALEAVQRALARRTSQTLIPNAAGAVGAILSDLGYTPEDVRGFALVARCGGLVAHIADERRRPIGRTVWQEAHERAATS